MKYMIYNNINMINTIDIMYDIKYKYYICDINIYINDIN